MRYLMSYAVARKNCVNSNYVEKVFNLAANRIYRSGCFPSSYMNSLWRDNVFST